MGFYESISAYYDAIFPVDPQTVNFLSAWAEPGPRVLDIACGTGGHALALAARGFDVSGIDLDRAMIAEARRKAARDSRLKAAFEVLDMQRVRQRFEPGFRLVYCIGNSLVHLEDEERIGALLRDCHALLEPGGALVVQIIHYDRILAQGLTELPTLHAANLEFERRYDYEPGSAVVQFRTELRVREAGMERRIENCVPLWILKREALERLALQAGFRELRLYGGFDGRALEPQSLPLILSGLRG